MNEFLEQFLIESRELVDQATDDLLALEQRPEDRERLDSAFRAFHTLKGGAGIVDFTAMGRLLHTVEDVLASVRSGAQPVTVDLISHCLTCVDQVVQWLDAMEQAGEVPADADAAADRLAGRFEADAPASLAQPEAEGPPAWASAWSADSPEWQGARTAIRYAPDPGCFFRGEDPLALIAGAPGLLDLRLEPASPWAPLASLDPFACNLVISALFSAGPEDVAAHMRAVSDQWDLHVLPEPAGAPHGLSETAVAVLQAQIDMVAETSADGFSGRLRSAARVVDQLLAAAGLHEPSAALAAALDQSLTAGDVAALLAVLRSLRAAPDEAPLDENEDAGALAATDSSARALRVDIERIDDIINLTGELAIVKNALGHAVRLAQNGGDGPNLARMLHDQHAQLDRLTLALQRSMIAMRVLPLRHVFHRFARLVREMAASLDKSALLVTEGEETEADKAVVETLFEPLLHLIRNALDHGVEPSEVRRTAGKPERATIRLRGYREGERVIIEVADDGRGIDPAAVRRIAGEKGLITGEALAAVSDEDVLDLIFAPGFSTAASVTALSGRGVGMDAVRTAIERLGGQVSVSSVPDQGTVVRLALPFTVLMSRLMTVEAAGQVFGAPFEAIVETLQIDRDDIRAVGAGEAFVLRGRTVPLVSLGQTLGLAPSGARPATVKALVTTVGGHLGALEVDGFGESIDVMIKPIGGLLANTPGVAGTTILGDGRVLIVLDLQELLR
jgi:two-component system chemotaxis sensor kinase CheA